MRSHPSTAAAAPPRSVSLVGALARIRMGAPRMVMVVTPPGAAVSRSPAPGPSLAWEPPSADRRVPEPSTGWLQLGVAPNDPGVDRSDGRQMLSDVIRSDSRGLAVAGFGRRRPTQFAARGDSANAYPALEATQDRGGRSSNWTTPGQPATKHAAAESWWRRRGQLTEAINSSAGARLTCPERP